MKIIVSYSTEFGMSKSEMKLEELTRFISRYNFNIVGIRESSDPVDVFLATHNPMVEESANYTISVHTTEEGAKKASDEHKEKARNQYEEDYMDVEEEDRISKFGTWESWSTEKMKLNKD